MNKYEDYFIKFEKQFDVKLEEWHKIYFLNNMDNKQTIITGRKIGKDLLAHLITLYPFYKTNTLNQVVKLYNYFYIVKHNDIKRKTDLYSIVTKGTSYVIGEIKWWSPWRKYCFFPGEETVYDNKCLKQIMDFLNEINLARYKDKEQSKYEI